jgi:hypothetical protein
VLDFDEFGADASVLRIHKGSTDAGADRSLAGRRPFVEAVAVKLGEVVGQHQ